MSEKEKYYHIANFILMPVSIVSLIIFDIFGSDLLNSGMSDFKSTVYWLVTMISVGWLVISGLVNENSRNLVIRGIKSIFKSVFGVIATASWVGCFLGPFEIIVAVIVLSLIAMLMAVLWEVGAIGLSVYLLVTSYKAVRDNESVFV